MSSSPAVASIIPPGLDVHKDSVTIAVLRAYVLVQWELDIRINSLSHNGVVEVG